MDTNYTFFKENLQNLLKDYKGKYIAIKEQKVIGSYNSFDAAYNGTTKTEEVGTFLIQHCTENALEPAANFACNNVSFSMAAKPLLRFGFHQKQQLIS